MIRIVIIGAGSAGLTATLELKRKLSDQHDAVVLEENDTVGGISRTVKYKNNFMDLGGHRFFEKLRCDCVVENSFVCTGLSGIF